MNTPLVRNVLSIAGIVGLVLSGKQNSEEAIRTVSAVRIMTADRRSRYQIEKDNREKNQKPKA